MQAFNPHVVLSPQPHARRTDVLRSGRELKPPTAAVGLSFGPSSDLCLCSRMRDNDALTKMRGLIFGFLVTRSIAVAAELGVADRLADGPRTPAELAAQCGVLERPLYRVLRALAGEGIFAETNDGRFALTPMAELLRADHSSSLRDWAIYLADLPYRGVLELLHNLKTGEPAFEKTFGIPLFDSLSAHAEYSTQIIPRHVQHQCCSHGRPSGGL
jgi:hypothetical protein